MVSLLHCFPLLCIVAGGIVGLCVPCAGPLCMGCWPNQYAVAWA